MAKPFDLDRLYVATLLPYKAGSYEIDEVALRASLRYYMQPMFLNAGGAIIINPEAGELYYLSREEKRRAVEIAMEECGGKVPVFAGVIDFRPEDCIAQAKDAKELGVDGLFLIPMQGGSDVTNSWDPIKAPEVIIDFFKEIIDAVDLPAIVHPTARTGVPWNGGIPAPAVVKICTEIPQVVGWKMTYGYDGWRLTAGALRSLPRHVAVLAAAGNYFHENLANDMFDGTVTGCFAYAMEPMIEHIEAWRRGDIKKAKEIWLGGLYQLQQYVFEDYGRMHVRYKAAAWLRGFMPEPFQRPPMPKPKQVEIRTLRKLLGDLELNLIDEAQMEPVMRRLMVS